MRPDKKKTRHHDSQKSKKKALEKASKDAPSKKKTEPLPPPQPKIESNWANIDIPSEEEEDPHCEDWGETGPKF
ncbi:Hypothetical protein FKW44_012040, partial [Caligus rogercresseyi]